MNQEDFKDLCPPNGHVLIQAQDTSYQSKNGILTNLKQGGSAIIGKIIKVGEGVPEKLLDSPCVILKYEAIEIMADLYVVSFKDDKVRLYKLNPKK